MRYVRLEPLQSARYRTNSKAPSPLIGLTLYFPTDRLSTQQTRPLPLLSRADKGARGMKRLWTNDDLVAHWTLQPNELALVEYIAVLDISRRVQNGDVSDIRLPLVSASLTLGHWGAERL